MSWQHACEVKSSRGKSGGYNVFCKQCEWHSGPFRDRREAESAGRAHADLANKPFRDKGIPEDLG